MSDNVCPMCGYSATLCNHSKIDYAAEIARLQSALEKAEREKGDADKYRNMMTAKAELAQYYLDIASKQRDEAGMWAKYYQKLAQSLRCAPPAFVIVEVRAMPNCKHAKRSYKDGRSDGCFDGIYTGPYCKCEECQSEYARGFADGLDEAVNEAEGKVDRA